MHNPFLILNSAFITALQCELGQDNCNTLWICLQRKLLTRMLKWDQVQQLSDLMLWVATCNTGVRSPWPTFRPLHQRPGVPKQKNTESSDFRALVYSGTWGWCSVVKVRHGELAPEKLTAGHKNEVSGNNLVECQPDSPQDRIFLRIPLWLILVAAGKRDE